jgi:nucleotide-binding universal stress UspA family protein
MSRFQTRLVGVAWPEPAQDAIALAQALDGPDGIVLAHAYVFDPEAPAQFAAYGATLRTEAERMLAEARDLAGIEAELVAIPEPSPARGLHRVAQERDAGAIVVGACHRGRLGRAILGDVARATLHGAPCPVAVAPLGYRDRRRPIRTIGVAFDGRPESDAALAVAAELADELGARLVLRWVLVPPEAFPLSPESVEGWVELAEDLRADARTALQEALGVLDVPAEGAVVEGSAGRKLCELAEEVDLLVCGSRGWGTPKRVVLGSTSDHVIHHATSPVLVVPRVDDE